MTEPTIQEILSRLSQVKSSGIIERYGFNEFLMIAKEVRERVSDDVWLQVCWEILQELGLQEFYGCDYDILEALDHIPPESDLVDIQTFLKHSLVETLLEQFEAGGTTILLNIANMVGTPAAALIPKIIELRTKEIEQTIIQITGREIILYDVFMRETGRTTIPVESVNLEPLWLTAYGYQTLCALKLGLYTSLDGLERIEQTLRKLDVILNVSKENQVMSNSKTKMSEALKSIILKKALGK